MYLIINKFFDHHIGTSDDCSCIQLADGLILEKRSCPLGVILVIFESRPDALVQVKVKIPSYEPPQHLLIAKDVQDDLYKKIFFSRAVHF